MDEKELQERIADIKGALTIDDLKAEFASAFAAARSLGDSHAMACLNDAKDERKAALEREAQPA